MAIYDSVTFDDVFNCHQLMTECVICGMAMNTDCSLTTVFSYHRLLKNYEYDPSGEYCTSITSVSSHLKSDQELLQRNGSNPLTKGRFCLRDNILKLWKGQVVETKFSFNKEEQRIRAFRNLRRKDFNSVDGPQFSECPASEHFIQVPGWQVAINNDKSLSILRIEDWLLDGQRVVTEIRADQGQENTEYKCILSAHGHRLDTRYTGLNLGQMSSPKEELEMLAKCLSITQLCKGFKPPEAVTPLCEGSSLHDAGFLAHASIKIAEYSAASDPTAVEIRIFSGRCQIFRSSKVLCSECKMCQNNFVRKLQRDRGHAGNMGSRSNHRYMSREQLLSKLRNLQKEFRNFKNRVKEPENKYEEIDGDDDGEDDIDDDNSDFNDGDVDDSDDDVNESDDDISESSDDDTNACNDT